MKSFLWDLFLFVVIVAGIIKFLILGDGTTFEYLVILIISNIWFRLRNTKIVKHVHHFEVSKQNERK